MTDPKVPRKWSRGMYAHAYREGWIAGYAARLSGDLIVGTADQLAAAGLRGLPIGHLRAHVDRTPARSTEQIAPEMGKGSHDDPYPWTDYERDRGEGTLPDAPGFYVAQDDGSLWWVPCTPAPSSSPADTTYVDRLDPPEPSSSTERSLIDEAPDRRCSGMDMGDDSRGSARLGDRGGDGVGSAWMIPTSGPRPAPSSSPPPSSSPVATDPPHHAAARPGSSPCSSCGSTTWNLRPGGICPDCSARKPSDNSDSRKRSTEGFTPARELRPEPSRAAGATREVASTPRPKGGGTYRDATAELPDELRQAGARLAVPTDGSFGVQIDGVTAGAVPTDQAPEHDDPIGRAIAGMLGAVATAAIVAGEEVRIMADDSDPTIYNPTPATIVAEALKRPGLRALREEIGDSLGVLDSRYSAELARRREWRCPICGGELVADDRGGYECRTCKTGSGRPRSWRMFRGNHGTDAPPGTCCVCGCTESAACDGGCAWADDTRTICTTCAPGVTYASPHRAIGDMLDELAHGTVVRADRKSRAWYVSRAGGVPHLRVVQVPRFPAGRSRRRSPARKGNGR